MRKLNDLKGKTFSRLTVISRAENKKNGSTAWLCQCECGNKKEISSFTLLSGASKSCGCLRSEQLTARLTTHGQSVGKETPEYRAWRAMRARCSATKGKHYEAYVLRGITVCEEWSSFNKFYLDMGAKPSENHSIDRIDNDKGYYKDNCRWALPEVQATNKRGVTKVVYEDIEYPSIKSLSTKLKVNAAAINSRVHRGLTLHEAISQTIEFRTRKESLQ